MGFEHIGMERQRIGDMQIHLCGTKNTIIKPHIVNMYLRVYLRPAEERGDVCAAGKQAVEHDRFLRQDKRHHIGRVYLLQINRERVGRSARSYTVRIEVLAGALEEEMIDRQRRIRRTIRQPTLAQRIDRIAEHDRAGQTEEVYQRSFLIPVETGQEMQVSSVRTGALLSQHRLLFLVDRLGFIGLLRAADRRRESDMGHEGVAESLKSQCRMHTVRLRRYIQSQLVTRCIHRHRYIPNGTSARFHARRIER